jgi:serine/threonine-protein kinase RsbT
MSPLYQRLLVTFQRYLSLVTTEALLRRALADTGLSADHLSARDLSLLGPHLDRGIRLFVVVERQEQLRREITRLGGGAPEELPPPQAFSVRAERDISEVRLAVRAMCAALNARSLVVQKIATIVSELARNIVSYTPGGTIELSVLDTSPRRLHVRATDSGSGIRDVALVLSGNYRSTTGLGKGLLGVKRLADRFDVQTGASGTRVEVELSV